MANFSTLIAEIEAYIKTNGEQEITGQILQNVLKDIVDTLGNGAVFKGIATTDGTPGTPDNNVFYFAALAGTYTNYGGAVLDGNTLHILGYNGSWTDIDTGVPSATAAATFAKIDGYYASLTAGAAENLVGRGSVPASFLRRTTGGTADVGTGSAKIAKLMGNSLVWNQLVAPATAGTETQDDLTFVKNSNGSYHISGTASADGSYELKMATGLRTGSYKVLVKAAPGSSADKYTVTYGNIAANILADNIHSNVYGAIVQIIFNYKAGAVIDVVFWPQIFDLTKMFGAGKEPSTIAEFEALFPLPYYAYEPGKVLPFAAEKLVTTGFNQWDEEWELGRWDFTNDGQKIDYASGIRCANYISVFGNTEYYFKTNGKPYWILWYDADKNFISTVGGGVTSSAAYTAPSNAAYMTFCIGSATAPATTYNHDICINLSWSGYRNGEYEPYELHEAIFNPANWEDADGNKIFPYGGMHGVGTARDFATPDTDGFIRKATQKMGRVDLGSLEWVAQGNGRFSVLFPNTASHSTATPANIICSNYITGIQAGTGNRVYLSATNYLNVVDSSYESATSEQFKAAMSGVYLYYELATPVETELAEPVAASYYANDFGTEEWQPANGAEPYTAPCELAIAYAMNAVDTLRRLPENYISAASFENFCTELATKLGAALNKSITIAATYDAENEEYDYAITIEDIEEG